MIEQRTRRLPMLGRVMSTLIATLVVALLLLGITAAGWAILYLIRTAP